MSEHREHQDAADAASKLTALAKILGVELGQEFRIVGNDGGTTEYENVYRITDQGIYYRLLLGAEWYRSQATFIAGLLTNKFRIALVNWVPRDADEYFYIYANGEVRKTIFDRSVDDLTRFAIGNCFRTKLDALAAINQSRIVNTLEQIYTGGLPKIDLDSFGRGGDEVAHAESCPYRCACQRSCEDDADPPAD